MSPLWFFVAIHRSSCWVSHGERLARPTIHFNWISLCIPLYNSDMLFCGTWSLCCVCSLSHLLFLHLLGDHSWPTRSMLRSVQWTLFIIRPLNDRPRKTSSHNPHLRRPFFCPSVCVRVAFLLRERAQGEWRLDVSLVALHSPDNTNRLSWWQNVRGL